MSIITPTQPATAPLPWPPADFYRMSVDEFERIADALDEQVELVNGYLRKRIDMNPPHVLVTERLRRRLDRMVPAAWFVREEKPVRIPDFDGEKRDVYARANIPVYWIVNLIDRLVEVYTDPGPAGYASSAHFKPGQEVPVVVDGASVGRIPVSDVMP